MEVRLVLLCHFKLKDTYSSATSEKFDEHVNDHQVEFARNVYERMGTIIPIEDIGKLEETIVNYEQIVSKMSHGMSSNNLNFNQNLEK